ncbi:endonuclease [Spirochaetia bacterium]|nr:endonuclease [Spirochaetia bacterium]
MTEINSDLQMSELEKMVVAVIENQKSITKDFIGETIARVSPIFPNLTSEHINKVQKHIEERFSFTMGIGDVLQEDFTPWLSEVKGEIDWYYWPKYRDHLIGKGFGPKVVATLDDVTERILSLAENPNKTGNWERKGMVVGHVQSGKTANYVGLISKAADAGYKVFIVIAGITNSLRKQTQMRIEQGFTGRDTTNDKFTQVGVGIKDYNSKKQPVTFTTVHKDFNKNTASQVGANIQSFANPVVFVIKKNTNTLQNIINWLRQSIQSNDEMAKIDDVPMMLIDDEADNASINTKQNPDETSRINALIRELLSIFKEKCYIGYTATPFANIFIDDTPLNKIGGDLFPRDFIYSLDAPSNYYGANKIFGSEDVYDIVRIISDHQNETGKTGLLPLVHKKDLEIEDLPQSLIDAVNMFFLVRAIRILRGDGTKHNSMLVNVSRFNDVQQRVREKLVEYLIEAQNSIRYSYKMSTALENPVMANLKELFDAEYAGCGFSWVQMQGKLHDATAPIKIYTINQHSQDALDYENYQNGLNIIAVGGLALSRGLTLEGLSISYLVRNTMMYDTLMQMGRWFGYRDGYEDLCRIYMPKESRAWYEFITEATNELISDFKYMASLGLSPKNFGLRVKKSPFKLLITAKNKMWHGTPIIEKVDLSGEYVETRRILTTQNAFDANQRLFFNVIEKLQSQNHLATSNIENGYLWQDVSADIVLDFIRDYKNHDDSIDTQMPSMHRFVLNMKDRDNLNLWDVVLISLGKAQKDNQYFDIPIWNPIKIIQPMRTAGKLTADGKGVEVSSRRRMASQGIERIGLTPEQIKNADKMGLANKDKSYRLNRTKPLLILFLTNLENDGIVVYEHAPVYGISFPFIHRDYEYEGEEYVANIQWMKENFGLLENDDEAEYDIE